MFSVEVKAIGGWTTHSTHAGYRDAVDQADLVGGRVLCNDGKTDEQAWKHAVQHQGYDGDFTSWQSQDDDERGEYEAAAAAGEPTA